MEGFDPGEDEQQEQLKSTGQLFQAQSLPSYG